MIDSFVYWQVWHWPKRVVLGCGGDNVRRNVMAQAMSSHKHRLVGVNQELDRPDWLGS